MKDRIFIVWSGTDNIAISIKKILETKKYKCIIGGNSDNSSKFSSIGDTVIQQIKSCNQAIVIFQNREDGTVSNNLFFELGYVLASYGQMKVHCVRKKSEQVVLPSDFDSSFVEAIDCDGSDDGFVNGILKYFNARQKMSINQNKMLLINNRYKMHDYVQSHYSEQGSKCSDYELAQYILFYMQASNMFSDEQKTLKEMRQFKDNNYTFFSDELAIAVNMSIAFFEMVINIHMSDNGEFYIDRTTYRRFREKYTECRNELCIDDTGAFDEWANVFTSQHLTYACSLYSNNPDLSNESRLKIAEDVIVMAKKAIDDLKVLEEMPAIKDNNDHKGLISLLHAYVYRNLFLVHKKLHNKNEELFWLKKTKKERTALKNNFELGSLDSKLYDNFAMEYYLTMIEYISNADSLGLSSEDIEDYKDEILSFIKKSKNQTDHSKYIERIEYLLTNV